MFWNEVRDVDRESRRLVAPYPFGETIPAVGGALLTWRTQPVDGVVSVAPRGCGPALIAEAQLRREAGLPALFVYADGDPIDEARLAGFAWRLRSRPARRVTAATAAESHLGFSLRVARHIAGRRRPALIGRLGLRLHVVVLQLEGDDGLAARSPRPSPPARNLP